MFSPQMSRISSLVAGLLLAASALQIQALETIIQVSPNVLNISSQGYVVTVHTDLPYSSVDVHSVFLNSVPIASSKADDQGNFVAKFDIEAVKRLDGLIIGADNALMLTGVTCDGEPFVGTDWVRVINVVPRGR
ncbi:hypothetical protein F2Q65_09520 [Thiohalocapsa marina]|uniref:Uncharacterized protein n=1 Tax=Thiohalocapsa marina TaxID=424902 RepID=A0A5M8FKU3_9GAMM|nr:hypothetical protein [Thiohalocapsa marina]KAA6185327.1 hypothetical protein F2Q65_09520 [Thiohalocapsa marina]